jgi:tRNA(Arg) A34 adenosine deaminase TadA
MPDLLLQRAVDLAVASANGPGGPFGALVARGDDVLAEGHNQVTAAQDPTAHAEVVALRGACRALGTHVLDGCVLFTSCEPCPMCLGAAWWARVERIVFAATRADAAAAGFDDAEIYQEVAAPLDLRSLPIAAGDVHDPVAPFEAWHANPARVPY